MRWIQSYKEQIIENKNYPMGKRKNGILTNGENISR